MPKYGRGLNREIVAAVNQRITKEPFSIADVKDLANQNGWNIPNNYVNCCLANGSSLKHSLTYKKYFISLGDGMYQVDIIYKGNQWK